MACPYCGQMHSPLYVCDERKAARAGQEGPRPEADRVESVPSEKPTPSRTDEGQRWKRWREKNPELYRERQREYQRRYRAKKRKEQESGNIET